MSEKLRKLERVFMVVCDGYVVMWVSYIDKHYFLQKRIFIMKSFLSGLCSLLIVCVFCSCNEIQDHRVTLVVTGDASNTTIIGSHSSSSTTVTQLPGVQSIMMNQERTIQNQFLTLKVEIAVTGLRSCRFPLMLQIILLWMQLYLPIYMLMVN